MDEKWNRTWVEPNFKKELCCIKLLGIGRIEYLTLPTSRFKHKNKTTTIYLLADCGFSR